MRNDDTMWGQEGDEELKDCVEDVVSDYLEEVTPSEVTRETTLTILGWKRREVTAYAIVRNGAPLDKILEWLDEDYGGVDDYIEQSEPARAAMRDAELRFAEAVAANFVSWRCEQDRAIEPVVINVAEWLAENDPASLEDGEAFDHLRVPE